MSSKKKNVKIVFENKNDKVSDSNEKNTTQNSSKNITHKHKSHKHVAHKHEAHKHEAHKKNVTHKKHDTKTRDFIIIGILAFLIIIVLVISFLIPVNTDTTPTDNLDANTTDTNLLDLPDIDLEDFQNRMFELNLRILTEIKDYQLEILSESYDDFNLNSEQMNTCILENDFLSQEVDPLQFSKISEIYDDFLLSQELGIVVTPTIYVNGYLFSGAKDYNTFTNFIDSVENTENLILDYEEKSFNYDSSDLKLYVIYDVENELINNKNLEFIDFIQESDLLIESVRDVFKEIFSIDEIVYLQYDLLEGKEILQTIDAESLPVYYLLGDISTTNFYNDEEQKNLFDIIFKEDIINEGYIANDFILNQLISQSSIDGVYKLLDYKSLIEQDHVIGNEDAKTNLLLFTDYDCPFCKTFETDTLTEDFITEYIDLNKANLVLKPIPTSDSLLPIIFLKCSEDQEKSLEVHKKIFELSPIIGFEPAYNLISEKYSQEINDIQMEYEILMKLYDDSEFQ